MVSFNFAELLKQPAMLCFLLPAQAFSHMLLQMLAIALSFVVVKGVVGQVRACGCPHMFTWGLLLITIWLLEADRRRPSRRVYLLIPMAMVWTNLHGGFMTLLLALAIYAVGVGAEQVWALYRSGDADRVWKVPQGVKRYGLLLVLCAAATLVNPYGYHLHEHIYGYLGSDFILDNVQEFQAPSFRGESQRVYEVILLVSILLLARLARRGEFASVLLLLAWAHASLMSVRHMPLFVMVAAPLIGRELTFLLEAGAKSGSSWLKVLHSLAEDYGGRGKALSESGPLAVSWLGVAAVAVVAVMLQVRAGEVGWKAEFSEMRFPKMACDTLSEPLKQKRVFSTDQWGDYLIYRFYPEVKVFFDGPKRLLCAADSECVPASDGIALGLGRDFRTESVRGCAITGGLVIDRRDEITPRVASDLRRRKCTVF